MVVRPNKPILFSVDHEQEAVGKKMWQFKEAVKGKHFLFIELTPQEVEQVLKRKEFSQMPCVAAYQKLVAEADKAGVKVIALDRKKFIDEARRAEIQASIVGLAGAGASEKAKLYYQDYVKREKDWLRKLESVGANTILVMHPGHATNIAKQLNLPKEHIIGKLWLRKEKRQIAEQEAARIEAARLERRKRKAKERMRRRPRK